MAKRQRFTKEFKLEAVRLWKSSGCPAAAVARTVLVSLPLMVLDGHR